MKTTMLKNLLNYLNDVLKYNPEIFARFIADQGDDLFACDVTFTNMLYEFEDYVALCEDDDFAKWCEKNG